ncbi:MAG: UDP-N-acetylmuramoyl-L-alanine--D-glutamate ligase [Anaerofustis sp.]
MEVANKTFMIVGAGRSGIAAARFLAGKQARMILTDTKTYEELAEEGYGIESAVNLMGVRTVFGRQPTEEEVAECDCLILSPGAPPDIPPCKLAEKHKIEVWSEIEFANSFYRGSVVAITGTNGKTTTTTLTGELFRDAGYETYVGGNIGDPFINYAERAGKDSVIALEISSFQLSMTKNLRPKIAVITNITPDHLDRHKTMECYIDAKAKIFANMRGSDTAILNYDDPLVRDLKKRIQCDCFFFTLKDDPTKQAFLSGDKIMLNIGGNTVTLIARQELNLLGDHNIANVMCASLAAYHYGVSLDSIRRTLRVFRPVEHRLEYVAEVNGVTYINDSKGTNPDASMIALKAMDRPVVLIMGGYDKHSDFTEMFDLIKTKVKHIVVLGQTKDLILQTAAACGYDAITAVENYSQAVEVCAKKAVSGDCVLLSPACASWGMFENYEQRGELFKELVRNLSK